MAFLKYKNIGVSALAGAVPRKIIKNIEYTDFFDVTEVKKIVEKTGIYERRFCDEKTCASDLCFAAAEKLINDNLIDRNEIDLLIFISQTPDYRMPATSILLQERLGLPTSTIAFDINLGCSGFLFGLSVAYSMIENSSLRKAIILDGETRSKVYSSKDRRTAFLFGDGGIAALIERDKKYGESFFSLNSDGSREDLIKINAGGYRNPSSPESVKEKVVDEFGNIRTEEQGYMNGNDVFNFVITEIPKDIKNILKYSGKEFDEIDYYIFHQANGFMNSFISKKLKLDKRKIPSTIEKYGNTSSVSIPLTIIDQLKDKLKGPHDLLLSSFGVGMSWGSAILKFDNCHISDIIEL